MKKYIILNVIFLIRTVLLFGCSNDKGNENVNPDQTEEKSDQAEQTDSQVADEEVDTDEAIMDIDKFIEEITKANKGLKSYSLESEVDTIQTLDDEKNHVLRIHEQDTIFDPFQTKSHIKTEQQDD